MQRLYTLEELAAEAAVTPRTVRFYQQIGLLPSPDVRGRLVQYGEHHLIRLRALRSLRDRGAPISSIKDMSDSQVAALAEGSAQPLSAALFHGAMEADREPPPPGRAPLMAARSVVLWANDRETIEQNVHQWAHRSGVALVGARTTGDALDLAQRCHFDAIVTNLRRPQDDSDALLAALATRDGDWGAGARPATGAPAHAGLLLAWAVRSLRVGTPVLVYTGRVDAAIRHAAEQAGATWIGSSTLALHGELEKRLGITRAARQH